MEASKNIDCYGCFPGHNIEQADAEQAYIQAELTGTETWVCVPEEAWPDSWWKTVDGVKVPVYDRPVCRLLRALYGHPDSGTMWEKHCHKTIFEQWIYSDYLLAFLLFPLSSCPHVDGVRRRL